MKRYHLYFQNYYDIGPHGRLHFHKDYDTVEEARQAAAVSDMHGYQIEDLKTRKVTEKGVVGNLTDMEQ